MVHSSDFFPVEILEHFCLFRDTLFCMALAKQLGDGYFCMALAQQLGDGYFCVALAKQLGDGYFVWLLLNS